MYVHFVMSYCFFDVFFLLFFFVKQKTAYEMRISDWSSDVCSSDLYLSRAARSVNTRPVDASPSASSKQHRNRACTRSSSATYGRSRTSIWSCCELCEQRWPPVPRTRPCGSPTPTRSSKRLKRLISSLSRSEEHTSELQSLMRSSYA